MKTSYKVEEEWETEIGYKCYWNEFFASLYECICIALDSLLFKNLNL